MIWGSIPCHSGPFVSASGPFPAIPKILKHSRKREHTHTPRRKQKSLNQRRNRKSAITSLPKSSDPSSLKNPYRTVYPNHPKTRNLKHEGRHTRNPYMRSTSKNPYRNLKVAYTPNPEASAHALERLLPQRPLRPGCAGILRSTPRRFGAPKP